jgi:uncharacterized membrane protein YfcA
MLGLGSVKEAAACGTVFIWLNSLVGISARLQFNSVDLSPYLPLFIAVMIGGLLGSLLGASTLPAQLMEKILGSVIIIAVFFLAKSLIFS